MDPVDKKKSSQIFFLTRPLLAVMKGLSDSETVMFGSSKVQMYARTFEYNAYVKL